MVPIALALAVIVAAAVPPVPADGIHSIDFKNFAYASTSCAPEGKAITVKAGVYERDDEDDRAYFEVRDVVYGDLTGDGEDEAVVSTLCNTGGTGQFTDAIVFTMRNGKPVELGTLGVGDRADGGLYRVEIRNRVLYADRFGQDGSSGACCPQYVETFPIRWNGSKLADAGPSTRRIYQDYQFDDSPAPHAVRFLRGTSAATLAGSTAGREGYRLGARAGQRMTLQLITKDAEAQVEVTTKSGAERLVTVRAGAPVSVDLPATAEYFVSIQSPISPDSLDTSYRLELSIH